MSPTLRSANKGKAIDSSSQKEDSNIVRKTTKRGRKKVTEEVPYMPGIVIYEILVRFSASFVLDCRLVNKEWRDIISRTEFVVQNFRYSDPQLVLQCPTSGKRTNFEVRIMKFDGDNRVCKLSNFDLPRMGLVRPSCFGLLLANVPSQPGFLRVLNPLTKKSMTLPRFPSYCPHKACAAALGFDPLAKEFKLVHMYTAGAGFEILTLGRQENEWRRVFLEQKEKLSNPLLTWRDPVLSENGRVLHFNVQSNDFILSMDIAEEQVFKTNLPKLPVRGMAIWKYVLLEMDGCVAAVYHDSVAIFSVWILKDYRTSLWEQRDDISEENMMYANDEDNILPSFKDLVPIGGFENGRYLVFKYDRTDFRVGLLYLFVYDMELMEMKKWYKVNKKMKDMEALFTYRSSLYHWTTFME